MSWTLIANTSIGSPDVNAVTSSSINTSGANLIIINVGFYKGINNPLAPTDSNSNTWLTPGPVTVAGDFVNEIFLVTNPIVGSGHTFTFGDNSTFPSFEVEAWSFVDGTNTDANSNNGGGVAATTLSTGSITPPDNGSLVIAGCMVVDTVGTIPTAIDSSFTLGDTEAIVAGQCQGSGIAYYVQPTSAAVNPTFTFNNSTRAAATIISFKEGTPPAATTVLRLLASLGVGR